MFRTTTRLVAPALTCALAALMIGCEPHDSVEAAEKCNTMAHSEEYREASRCLFDIVNDPKRSTRESTYALIADEATAVVTNAGRIKVMTGAELREMMISQIPMMEATGRNDTFSDIEIYTSDEVTQMEGFPRELTGAFDALEYEVMTVSATRTSSKDGEEYPFVMMMSFDEAGKWRVMGIVLETT
jgi:hypothetical protein